MAGRILTDDGGRAFDTNGVIISGAKCKAFLAGTSTPASLYTTSALSVAHASPVVASAAGFFAQMWASESQLLDIKLYAAADVTYTTPLRTFLNVTPQGGSGGMFDPPGSGGTNRSVQAVLADLAVNVMDYGAVADATRNSTTGVVTAVTDNATAFQAAIDYARSVGKRVFIPAGRYKIGATLFVGSGSGTYDQMIIFGEGYGLRGEMDGSILYFTLADRCGFAVQGARGLRFRDLSIIGPNLHYPIVNVLCTSARLAADITHENMVDPVILAANPHMLKRYSVNAAIATDPFMGSAPATPMPGGSYGVTLNSEDVVAEYCYIGGWAVAMALQPANVSLQSCYSGYRDCYIESCVWGLSVGTSQARNTIWANNKHAFVHTLITNKVHGQRIGLLHGDFSNSMTYAAIQFFDINTQYSGPITFRDCYSEELCRIGNLRVGGGPAYPVTISGCMFYFTDDETDRGLPISVLAKSARGQVDFNGCEFHLNELQVALFEGYASDYSFINCRSQKTDTADLTHVSEWAAHNFLANVCFVPSTLDDNRPRNFHFNHADALGLAAGVSEAGSGGRMLPDYSVGTRNMNLCAWPRKARVTDPAAPLVDVPQMWTALEKNGNITSVTAPSAGSVGLLTFTLPAGSSSEEARRNYGWVPGGVIVDTNDNRVYRIIRVTAGGTAVVVATLLNGRKASGALVDYGRTDQDGEDIAAVAFSSTAGFFLVGNGAVITPAYHYIATFGAGSANVTAVSRPDGLLGSTLDTHYHVGDSLWLDSFNDGIVPLASLKLSTVTNGTPGSMVLAGNATYASVRKPIPFIVNEDIADSNKP